MIAPLPGFAHVSLPQTAAPAGAGIWEQILAQLVTNMAGRAIDAQLSPDLYKAAVDGGLIEGVKSDDRNWFQRNFGGMSPEQYRALLLDKRQDTTANKQIDTTKDIAKGEQDTKREIAKDVNTTTEKIAALEDATRRYDIGTESNNFLAQLGHELEKQQRDQTHEKNIWDRNYYLGTPQSHRQNLEILAEKARYDQALQKLIAESAAVEYLPPEATTMSPEDLELLKRLETYSQK